MSSSRWGWGRTGSATSIVSSSANARIRLGGASEMDQPHPKAARADVSICSHETKLVRLSSKSADLLGGMFGRRRNEQIGHTLKRLGSPPDVVMRKRAEPSIRSCCPLILLLQNEAFRHPAHASAKACRTSCRNKPHSPTRTCAKRKQVIMVDRGVVQLALPVRPPGRGKVQLGSREARPNRKPWHEVTPAARSMSNWSSVSTPSAVVAMSRPRASVSTEAMTAAHSARAISPWVNDLSILILSTGNW